MKILGIVAFILYIGLMVIIFTGGTLILIRILVSLWFIDMGIMLVIQGIRISNSYKFTI